MTDKEFDDFVEEKLESDKSEAIEEFKNKTMTVKELLIPRFQLIAKYPQCPYRMGDILVFEHDHNGEPLCLDRAVFTESAMKEFSANFRKMEWWEERKDEELPKYVRSNNTGLVYEIEHYDTADKTAVRKGNGLPIYLTTTTPSTEEEFAKNPL